MVPYVYGDGFSKQLSVGQQVADGPSSGIRGEFSGKNLNGAVEHTGGVNLLRPNGPTEHSPGLRPIGRCPGIRVSKISERTPSIVRIVETALAPLQGPLQGATVVIGIFSQGAALGWYAPRLRREGGLPWSARVGWPAVAHTGWTRGLRTPVGHAGWTRRRREAYQPRATPWGSSIP
ncbi:MAG TPA: hypothetical protein VFE51_05255 [Verrucomicrobiae bacterium]|nr:hypothetical protein [Verrucomicrobiae bacterium]